MTQLSPQTPLTHWQATPVHERRFDVADVPMEGEMDPTFFVTRLRNVIPHTYPCRDEYIAQAQGKEPEPDFEPDWQAARDILPGGSAQLNLSGFWYRATLLKVWARTAVIAKEAGPCSLTLRVCGRAKLFVNGKAAGWLAPATRNAASSVEVTVDLTEGRNVLSVWAEDLAERDAIFTIGLIWNDGPAARQSNMFEVDPEQLDLIEKAVTGMHLCRRHYDDEEIWLQMPVPFPADATASVEICGHFMSRDSHRVKLELPSGQDKFLICHSSALPSDYRFFHITLTCLNFTTTLKLGAEVTNLSLLGPPPEDLPGRINETLGWIAAHAEGDTETALACLDQGGEENIARARSIIETELTGIEQCFDCADFALVPLLWAAIRHGDLLPSALMDRLRQAVLNYRFWMDEPGNDVQWYFSENHALLFHTSAYLAGNWMPGERFRRSGRSGEDQSETGRKRLHDWLDHFEKTEMSEFNSTPYFPIDLKGLLALCALAPDTDIRQRAELAIGRLLRLTAMSSHRGLMTAAQGRSYEHSLCATVTTELSGISRLLWGAGGFGAHVNCLAQLAISLRDHGLSVPDLAAQSLLPEGVAQEWLCWQGENGFCSLYHYKSRDIAMGSAALYRWFDWGYQETLLHARLGANPRAQLWVNHPGEAVQSGFGRPSFWGGSASVPRVQQYRNLAIIRFDGVAEQLPFTHAWFPTIEFDEWDIAGARASARSGRGLLHLRASSELKLISQGPSDAHELRAYGRDSLWIIRLGEGDDLAKFAKSHQLDAAHSDAKSVICVQDAEYGEVTFEPNGMVHAEGRTLDPKRWTLEGYTERMPIGALGNG